MIQVCKNLGLFKKGMIPWNKGLNGWNKGHPVSEETKKKIGLANSISLIGRIPWNIGTKGICKVNSGSFKKGEHINKETEFKKGQIKSKNWKDVMSKRTEEKHQNWKGDNAGYHAIHKWIKKHKGYPKYCESCGM
jgi:translation elongation factor EF-1alpha